MNWVCDCGIVNWHGDKACGQCGELRVDSWAEADRARTFVVRTLCRDDFRDVVFCLDRGDRISGRLASLCQQPFLRGRKDQRCR